MKQKEAKNLTDAIRESASNHVEMTNVLNGSTRGIPGELKSTEKLWREKDKSVLIKAGLVLIAFPDPTISDIVGAGMVAAGLIQMKMKHSALHMEDVYKTFPALMKELGSLRRGAVQQ